MKSVITTQTGGMPFYKNHILGFMQESLQEISNAISKGLSLDGNPYIVNGCLITVSDSGGVNPLLNITAGAIWYLDEVYLVDTVTNLPLPAYTTQYDVQTTYSWDLSETITTAVVFKDTTSKNIHKIRKAVLTLTPTTWSGLINLTKLEDKLLRYASESQAGYIQIATNSEVQTHSGTNKAVVSSQLTEMITYTGADVSLAPTYYEVNDNFTGSNLKLRVLNNGWKHLSGYVITTSSAGSMFSEFDLLTDGLMVNRDYHFGTGYNLTTAVGYAIVGNTFDSKLKIRRTDGTAGIEASSQIFLSIFYY